jgi:hypothetical protein
MKADFVQYRNLKGIPKPIKSEGTIVLWEGHGLVWTTKSPFPNAVLISHKGLYQIENKRKISMVKAGGDSGMFDVMAEIFAIGTQMQVKGFSVTALPAEDNQWKMRLTPINAQVKNFIQTIDIEGVTHINRIIISRPSGDHDDIELKNHIITEGGSRELQELFNE